MGERSRGGGASRWFRDLSTVAAPVESHSIGEMKTTTQKLAARVCREKGEHIWQGQTWEQFENGEGEYTDQCRVCGLEKVRFYHHTQWLADRNAVVEETRDRDSGEWMYWKSKIIGDEVGKRRLVKKSTSRYDLTAMLEKSTLKRKAK